jgi:hypothetical protein
MDSAVGIMRSPKHTAWKKSRKFGDIHGGRMRRKCTDNIFNRLHSFSRPGPHDPKPILVEDNPSGDHYFPLSGAECLEALKALPKRDPDGITHLWLRRATSRERKNGPPIADYICGSGVRLIVLYPWRKDHRLCLGRRKPNGKASKEYQRFDGRVFQERGWWYVEFTPEGLRRYMVHVLYYEVGAHVDLYSNQWSKASRKADVERSDQYAMSFSREGAEVLHRLDQNASA